MDDFLHISEHGFQRAKERLSLGPDALRRTAAKAFHCGVTHAETSGRLNKWLSQNYQHHQKGNCVRIYGLHVFVFEGVTLITVLHVPDYLRSAALHIQAKRKERKA